MDSVLMLFKETARRECPLFYLRTVNVLFELPDVFRHYSNIHVNSFRPV